MFGDLAEADQRRIKEEMRKELEEIEVARLREKLAWYQKTRNGVVQKADTTKASSSKVNPTTLTPEELAHLVDVSVAWNYGMDLAQLTHVLVEDVRNTIDSLKQDIGNNLPVQVRLVVKEVVGEVQGKCVVDHVNTPTAQAHATPNSFGGKPMAAVRVIKPTPITHNCFIRLQPTGQPSHQEGTTSSMGEYPMQVCRGQPWCVSH
jgi:hypothetical protein